VTSNNACEPVEQFMVLSILMATTRVISSGDLYLCLLPRCEALGLSDRNTRVLQKVIDLPESGQNSDVLKTHLPQHIRVEGKTRDVSYVGNLYNKW